MSVRLIKLGLLFLSCLLSAKYNRRVQLGVISLQFERQFITESLLKLLHLWIFDGYLKEIQYFWIFFKFLVTFWI